MIKKLTVAEYLEQQINMSGKSQKEIAEEMGYEKPNIITMFKQGKTRLPINKVADCARALEIDTMHLLRLAMNEYMPETWAVLEQVVGDSMVTAEEMKVVELMRKNAGGQPVQPETEEDINAFTDLVKGWKKRRDSYAAAAAKRIAAAPKNKRT